MKPDVFLRIAAVLMLIQAVLHTIGGVFGEPEPGAAAAAVAAMKSNQFLLLGNTRSYWDFYMGMGLGITISLTVEAIVLWMLGSLAKSEAARLRPILAAFLAGYLALAVNAWRYFFIGPVITELLIALCLVLAITTARSATSASI